MNSSAQQSDTIVLTSRALFSDDFPVPVSQKERFLASPEKRHLRSAFVRGAEEFATETDARRRLELIRDAYLPHLTLDGVAQVAAFHQKCLDEQSATTPPPQPRHISFKEMLLRAPRKPAKFKLRRALFPRPSPRRSATPIIDLTLDEDLVDLTVDEVVKDLPVKLRLNQRKRTKTPALWLRGTITLSKQKKEH